MCDNLSNTSETRVIFSEDGRGHATIAARDFSKGEVVFKEPPISVVFPSRDPPWIAAMRTELQAMNAACAWQYCMAVHCLVAGELPQPIPPGTQPLAEDRKHNLLQLCGGCSDDGMQPSELAQATAEHVLRAVASEAGGPCQWPTLATQKNELNDTAKQRELMVEWLAHRLDDAAGRISRNGFQIVDMTTRPPVPADGLFHRISFFNHCCAGLNNASWVWNGSDGCITVKTTRDVAVGEELTISYITKPWCDLATGARRRYLEQNFNFLCLCKACMDPSAVNSTSNQTTQKKSDGKLDDMLIRWMTDEHDAHATANVEENKTDDKQDEKAGSAKPSEFSKSSGPKVPLTDEERIERVLLRCTQENLNVSIDQARSALEEEKNHVGRAMILLRRQR